MRWFRRSPQAPHASPAASEGDRSTRASDLRDAGRDERLSAYLDGELTTAEAAGVEWEAEGDEAVREALEGMRSVRSTLGALGVEAAPHSFALSPATVAQPRRMPRLELGMRVATVAAALVTVAVFVSPSMTGSDDAAEDATLTAFSSAPQQRNAAAEAPADSGAESLQSAPAPEAAPALVPFAPGAPGRATAEDASQPPKAQGAQQADEGVPAAAGGRSSALGSSPSTGDADGGNGGGGTGGATSGGGGSRGDLWSAPRVGALGLTLVLGASAIGLWSRRRSRL